MTYAIEKEVELPSNSGPKYPFAQLEKGDSFTFDKSLAPSVRNAASSYASRNPGYEFTVSAKRGDEKGRCWRV